MSEAVVRGTGQLNFVSGEAGVGRSTLVELFLARLDDGGASRRFARRLPCAQTWNLGCTDPISSAY